MSVIQVINYVGHLTLTATDELIGTNIGPLEVIEYPGNGIIQTPEGPFKIANYSVFEEYRGFIITVKTDNVGTSNDDQFTIPTDGGTFDYSVDWGDGTNTTGHTGNVTHTFPVAGTYTIRITGTFPNIYFNNGGDKLKLLTIENWGPQQWSGNMNFYGCANLTANYSDIPNTTGLTTLINFMNGCSLFNGNMGFDTSNINTLENAFYNCVEFQGNGISDWDTSNVTSLYRTFAGCEKLNVNISSWNVAKVTTMYSTFFGCSLFNSDISSWTTTALTNMGLTFKNAIVFNSNIGLWNVSKVTAMQEVLRNCTAFDQNLSSWQISLVANFTYFLHQSKISTSNYDALLISFSGQTVIASLSFSGGTSKYSAGAATTARAVLTNPPNSWTIADGGQA